MNKNSQESRSTGSTGSTRPKTTSRNARFDSNKVQDNGNPNRSEYLEGIFHIL